MKLQQKNGNYKKKKETKIQAYLMLLCSAVLGFLHLEIKKKKSLDGFNSRREKTKETMNLIDGNYPT